MNKTIRRIFKKLSQNCHKYVNGTKGAVSLLLIILMLPFFGLAAFLAEINRWQSAQLILDNSMNNAALSVLADYDDAIYKKYGLMSVSPTANIDGSFKEYLKNNLEGVSKASVTLENNISAEGTCNLSNISEVKRQIAEYNKFNAPLTIADRLFDISGILGKVDNLTNKFNCVTNISKSLDAAEGMHDSLVRLEKTAKELEGITDYDKKWKAFDKAVGEYTTELMYIYRGEREENELLLAELRESAENAACDYITVCKKLCNTVKTFKKQISDLDKYAKEYAQDANAALNNFNKSNINKDKSKKEKELADVNKQLKGLKNKSSAKAKKLLSQKKSIKNDVADLNAQECESDALTKGLNAALQGYFKDLENWRESKADEVIQSFDTPVVVVAEKYGDERGYIEYLKNLTYESNSDPNSTDRGCYYPDSRAWHAFNKEMVPYKTVYAAKSEIEGLADTNNTPILSGIVSFFNSVFKTQVFFNRELTANVNCSFYDAIGGLPSRAVGGPRDSFSAIIAGLAQTMKKSMDVLKPGINILKKVKEVKELIGCICQLSMDIVALVKQIGSNITELLTGNYQKIFTMTYFSSVLSNRLNYDLTDPVDISVGAASKVPLLGDLLGVASLVKSRMGESGGSDKKFNGAELEYIFAGSSSEVLNQVTVFFAIYFVRLLLDISPVISNDEISIMTKIPYIGPIIMALIVFSEPFVDTILLVNGSEVELIKSKVYLTPTGIPGLVEQFTKITSAQEKIKNQAMNFGQKTVKILSKSLDDEGKERLNEGIGKLKSKMADQKRKSEMEDPPKKTFKDRLQDIFKFGYDQYVFLIMLILGNEDAYFARLSDLVQMYGQVYWENQGLTYNYNIYHAFTQIESTVEAKYKSLLPLPSSVSKASFDSVAVRKQVRAY